MSALYRELPETPSARPPIVPVIPERGQIDDTVDRRLSELGRSDGRFEPALRNALFTAYAPRLHRILRRLWYRNLSEFGCDLADLEQELFLIFVSLLEKWSGDGSLSAYLHGAVPWRLYDAARRLTPRERPMGERQGDAIDAAGSQIDHDFGLLLEAIGQRLSRFDRDLFLWHVRDERTLTSFAQQRGLSPRTVRRAWLRLRLHLQQELTP